MRTISINTTQNVAIDYELAGLVDRLLAFLIDTIILVLYLSTVLWFAYQGEAFDGANKMMLFIIIIFLLFPPLIGYHLACEALWNGQSIGKKALKIKVIKCNGQQMDIRDYGKRWMFRLVDIFFSCGSMAVLTIMSNDYNQRLGDIVGDTCVVKMSPRNQISIHDVLKIKNQDNYEPKYEGVVRFTEEDMLLLKNTLDRAKINPNEHYKKLLTLLTNKICKELEIKNVPKKRTKFLKMILNDYIVLTR
ncbi:MAG: RDD family protein [Flavobacteriales bacterium]|nr:RDD family protein [Flavobacteriales bacterium]